MKRKSLIVLMLVMTLVLSLVVPGYANPGEPAQNQKGPAYQAIPAFDQRIVKTVDLDRALEHIRYMSKEIGTRPGGLENEKIAAEYIDNYFKKLGYDTEIQTFNVGNQYIGNITVHDAEDWFGQGDWGFNEWHGTVWETGASRSGLITGDDSKVSGYVVDCGTGGADEFPADVEGNIALVERGESFNNLVSRATNAGAVGLLIYSVTGSRGQYGSAFSPNVSADIPVLGLALAQGQWLKEMAAEFPVYVDIQTWSYTDLTSQNVVAFKPAKDADAPIVVIGGHYDSVVGAPGANDNLSGTAVVMELARVFKSVNTDYEIRFAVWGSEERGLLGAREYVNRLSDEEIERHIANYNADMVATSEYERAPYFFVETVDGNPNIVTETMLAAADRLGYDEVRHSRFSSSDHVPFHNAGIPAALFIWLGGEGTPQNYTIERFYHTPQDTLEENVCPDRLQLALEVIGAAVFDVVRKPVPALERSAVGRER
jgi:aminopeptidase YwaD